VIDTAAIIKATVIKWLNFVVLIFLYGLIFLCFVSAQHAQLIIGCLVF